MKKGHYRSECTESLSPGFKRVSPRVVNFVKLSPVVKLSPGPKRASKRFPKRLKLSSSSSDASPPLPAAVSAGSSSTTPKCERCMEEGHTHKTCLRFRTRLCLKEPGKCWDSSCPFAHSLSELRIRPNSKTMLCVEYMSTLGCSRCVLKKRAQGRMPVLV